MISILKGILLIALIFLTANTVFPQTGVEKEIRLSLKSMKKRIVNQSFPEIPESVRQCHVKGSLVFHVRVDTEGKVKEIAKVTGLCTSADSFIQQAVANWCFQPLKSSGRVVPFRGIIQIPFCYGGIGSCY